MHHHQVSKFHTLNKALRLDRLAPWLLLLAVFGLLCLGAAHSASATEHAAALPVAVVEARAAQGYAVTRRYAGDVVASQRALLGFEQPGRLAHAAVDLGDRVQRGDLLMHLDERLLAAGLDRARAGVAQARARLAQANANLDLQQLTRDRVVGLVQRGHVSQQDGDREDLALQAARAAVGVAEADLAGALAAEDSAVVALEQARITAPFDGTVQARMADPGQVVQPGEAVLEVVSDGLLEAHVGIPAARTAALRPGQPLSLDPGGTDQPILEGVLRRILPASDPVTRTRTLVVDLPAGAPAPGALVELLLLEEVAEPGYWLPLTSLTEASRGLWAVFVVNAAEQAERRLVDVLHSEDDRVYVRGTLDDGDRVVAGGTQRIVAGQALQVVPRRAG